MYSEGNNENVAIRHFNFPFGFECIKANITIGTSLKYNLRTSGDFVKFIISVSMGLEEACEKVYDSYN